MKNHRAINGRLGGLLVVGRYSHEYFVELGKKGGRPTVETVNGDNYKIWGSKQWRNLMRRLEA